MAARATMQNIENLYREIVDDDDYILEQSKRDDVYERMKHRDSHIAACWSSRAIPVASAAWKIESDNDAQREEIERQVREWPNWQQYNEMILDSIFRGFAGVEIEMNKPGKTSIVKNAISIKQDNLTFTQSGEPRLITQAYPNSGEQMLFPQFAAFSWGETRHGNPRGKGIAQGLFWPWFFKHKGFKFWAKALERFGMPGIKAKIGGDPNTKRTRWKKILRDYVGGTGVLLDVDDDVSLLGAITKIGDSHEMFESFFNAEISKRVLGQTLTTEQGAKGSQALGRVHATVRENIMVSDATWLAGQHSRFTLPMLGYHLFGDAYVHARFSFLWESIERQTARAQRLEALSRVRLPMRREDVYDIAGVTAPAEGDDLFEWPAQAQGMPQGGATRFAESGRGQDGRLGRQDADGLTLASTVEAIEAFQRDGALKRMERRLTKKG